MASAAELMVLFKGDSSGLNAETGKAGGLISGLVGGLGKLGLAGMGFGVIKDAASAVVGPLMDSIGAAEGLGDAVARSEGIFGPASGSIVAAAKSQANALGLTQEAYISSAAKMGDLVTGMGVGEKKAAEMSTGLASIAPKLAAFTGMDPQSALDAMSKGLTGATKGLKEMGITIPEIPKGLDEAGKAAFIYDEILKQSGAASAAWSGNSGDVETSMARVSAAMTDAKAAIGEKLLPIIAPLAEKLAGLAGTLAEKAGPAIDSFMGLFGKIDLSAMFAGVGEALGSIDFAGIFGTIKEAIAGIDWKGIGETVMNLVGHFKDGLAVVLPIVAGIFQNVLMPIISTVFGFLMEHSEILAIVGAAFLALSGPIGLVVVAITAIGLIVPKIQEWWATIGADMGAAWEGFKTTITDAAAAIWTTISEKWQAIKDYLFAKLAEIGADISAAWTAIKDVITDRIEAARVMISAKWDAIKEYLDAKLGQISAAVAAIWDGIKAKIADAMQAVSDKINEVWTWIGDKIQSALDFIHGIVSDALDWIEQKTGASMDGVRTIWDSAMTFISGIVDTAIAFLTGHWGEAFETLKSTASDAWENIKSIFSEAWEGLKRILNIDDIVAKFSGLREKLETIGGDIIGGLKAGIKTAFDTMLSWLGGLFDGLPAPIKKALGITSPSKVMRDEIGVPIGQGVIAGIKASLNAESAGGIIAGWATKQGPGFIAQIISPVIGAAIGVAISAALVKAGAPPELVNSGKGWSAWNNVQGGSRVGIQPGSMGKDSDDGRVRADAFRSGKGGHIAASSSNYWKVFVQRFGIPTESSARKVSAQLGIPLPQWLLDIFNPPQGETVDRPDVLKDPAAAVEAGFALTNLAKAATDAGDALKGVPVRFALEVEKAAGVIGAAIGGLDDLIPRMGGSNPGLRPLPPGGIGGIGIPIPGPGGSVAFGGGSGGITDMAINAQSVTLRGPLNIGMTATLAVGGGRSLTAELVAALVTDTTNLDKLIEAEDRRRAQKS